MLTPELVEFLLAPVSDALPCGENLEYDPAFTALWAAAQGKSEQQFGDTVIAAVEPEWRVVAEQAQALLQRTKDLRPAVLLTRAAAREQGLDGLLWGLQLIGGLLDRYWDHLYPLLDADDGNDPTMRINALAPLTDETMLLRDLYEARIGVSRSFGPLRVREVAASHGALPGAADMPPQAQVRRALEEILAERPELAQTFAALGVRVAALNEAVSQRSGRGDLLDLNRLAAVSKLLAQVAREIAPEPIAMPDASSAPEAASVGAPDGAAASAAAPHADVIRNRQEALRMLDRLIAYFEQAEPGNPAPLLLGRAKQLIGVSFLDIVANLAPGALDAIENVTGRRPAPE
jgi:type VI secretion system protein ImpA